MAFQCLYFFLFYNDIFFKKRKDGNFYYDQSPWPSPCTESVSCLLEVNGKLVSMSMLLYGFFLLLHLSCPDRQVIDRKLHMPGILFP